MEEGIIPQAEKQLGIVFKHKQLLRNALTHDSFLTEPANHLKSFQRLEFLGDAILNFIITDFLYTSFSNYDEGVLAKLRANLVNADVLVKIAGTINLGRFILVGPGLEIKGRGGTSILADCLEAVIGAIYLDHGTDVARQFILKNFKEEIEFQSQKADYSDPKTALQEYTMSKLDVMPEYQVVSEEGPVHDKTFFVEVVVKGKKIGKGKGKSKKKAELQAAKVALKRLKDEYG